ncbi:lamin tail domain-containing protein [Patescibacteria group bacterium]|nr:lamin tail domain-containing protein [Patescibacteria group bacterium]
MVAQIAKIVLFLALFGFNFSFAFDARTTHPDLTDEVVNFYNSYAERKISDKERNLLKRGSIREDNSPRWVNHFFDPVHNTGLVTKYFRGAAPFSTWANLLNLIVPSAPEKSPTWVQDEEGQLIYDTDQTFQESVRAYSHNKDSAFVSLGHVLHLLEDLGVRSEERRDPKSDYENFAKEISQKYYLNFSQELIDKKSSPLSFSNIDSVFKSLADFTANNFFSQDTIGNDFYLPAIKSANYINVNISDRKAKIYYTSTAGGKVLFCIDFLGCTTDYPLIHEYWLRATYPEIIKHGAALLGLYFQEIKSRENDPILSQIENIQARDSLIKRFFHLTDYFSSKKIIWTVINPVVGFYGRVEANIQSFFNPVNKQPLPSILFADASNQTSVQNQPNQKISNQEKTPDQNLNQNRTTSNEIRVNQNSQSNLLSDQNFDANILNPNRNITVLSTSSIIRENSPPTSISVQLLISTSTATTSTEYFSNDQNSSGNQNQNFQNQIQPNNQNQPVFFAGGGSIPTPVQSNDSCLEAKNKTQANVLISEIKFEGVSDSDDEYVELYNPTDKEIDLNCWQLQKYSSRTGSSSPSLTTLVPASKFTGKIRPFSFFLISNFSVKEKYQADLTYAQSYSISKNNSILLKKPNNEISDLVGAGDASEKIYQAEAEPFLAEAFKTRTIQRKNLEDSDNNKNDFWLHSAQPENSNSPSRQARPDFLDLNQFSLNQLSAGFATATENFDFSFSIPTSSIDSANYFYNLIFNPSAGSSSFSLIDFGSTSTLPQPDFSQANFSFETIFNQCPASTTIFSLGLFLQDKLDQENKSNFATTSFALSDEFCGLISNRSVKDHSLDDVSLARPGKVLIAEVMTSASSSQDEYVELYNPNPFPVNLDNWSLVKYSKTGNKQTILPGSKFTGVIKPFGYYLIVNEASSFASPLPDLIFARSYGLAKDNAVELRNGENEKIDLIGWGVARNFEDVGFDENPSSGKVIVRKAGAESTTASLAGAEKNYGNSFDRDNNQADFILTEPNPLNSDFQKVPPNEPIDINIGNPLVGLVKDRFSLKLEFTSPYRTPTATPTSTAPRYELRSAPVELSENELSQNWPSLPIWASSTLASIAFRPAGYRESIEQNLCSNSNPADFSSSTVFYFGLIGSSGPIKITPARRDVDFQLNRDQCPDQILYQQLNRDDQTDVTGFWIPAKVGYHWGQGHRGQLKRIKLYLEPLPNTGADAISFNFTKIVDNQSELIKTWVLGDPNSRPNLTNPIGFQGKGEYVFEFDQYLELDPTAEYEFSLSNSGWGASYAGAGSQSQMHLHFFGSTNDVYDRGKAFWDYPYFSSESIVLKDFYFIWQGRPGLE